MTSAAVQRIAILAVACVTAGSPLFAQQSPLRLLDVPFVPQSEQLCGGAAAAMVMRYWGAAGVNAESFSSLVDRDADGIRGEDLIKSLQARGWQAASVQGDAALIKSSLNGNRPPIVLIEDRPGRFHYVVIVGWNSRGVVLHDPARAPFRILDEASFLRAWSRSTNWTLIALPPRDFAPAAKPDDMASKETEGACGSMVDEAIRVANEGSLDDAKTLLELAASRCPGEAAGWRELAGVHAVRKEWALAAADARRALALDSRDEHAARTLATSLYLSGEPLAALDAWNMVGEPSIDLVDIRGLERTRFTVVAKALRLSPHSRLTSHDLRRATHRLDALPTAIGTRVSYTPDANGLARVNAAVVERPVLPANVIDATATILRAGTEREARLNIASPSGGGELWQAAWRWWQGRQRVLVGVEAPAPFGGTWGVVAADERETFGLEGATLEEHRRGVSLTVADWTTATVAFEGGIGLDRWQAAHAGMVSGAVEYRPGAQNVVLHGRVAGWFGGPRTWIGSWSGDWRSKATNQGTVWSSASGVDASGDRAPLMLWTGAGTGQGRSALLRAHPLLDDGVIRDGVFGRRLIYGTAEWRRWGSPFARVLRVAPAAFVDVARAYRVPQFADRRAHVDIGLGVRLAIPGAGVLRADVAGGLRDGKIALSFGWMGPSAECRVRGAGC